VIVRYVTATYTVTFDGQGGTAPSPASKSVTYNSTYGTLATTTRTGYTFGGWWTATNGGGTQVLDTTVVTNTANHTLYAKWSVTTVSITRQGTQVEIAWTPAGGTLQSSPVLGTAAVWIPVGTNNPVLLPINDPTRFYRVVIP